MAGIKLYMQVSAVRQGPYDNVTSDDYTMAIAWPVITSWDLLTDLHLLTVEVRNPRFFS